MRPVLPALLLCLAACGAQPQAQTARSPDVSGSNVADSGCGASARSVTGNNQVDAVAACGPEMTPSERRRAEARARAGVVEAMMILARGTEAMPEKRRWYAEAAARGNCEAILQLTEIYEGGVGSSLSPAERRRWVAERRRLGCGVLRWTRENRALIYSEPGNPTFIMSVGCARGRVRIASFYGAAAPGTRLFRTSRGEQSRIMHADDRGAPAYDAAPDDEVLRALLRGERIEMRCPDCLSVTVDASGARALLPALVRQCTGSAG